MNVLHIGKSDIHGGAAERRTEFIKQLIKINV